MRRNGRDEAQKIVDAAVHYPQFFIHPTPKILRTDGEILPEPSKAEPFRQWIQGGQFHSLIGLCMSNFECSISYVLLKTTRKEWVSELRHYLKDIPVDVTKGHATLFGVAGLLFTSQQS